MSQWLAELRTLIMIYLPDYGLWNVVCWEYYKFNNCKFYCAYNYRFYRFLASINYIIKGQKYYWTIAYIL